MPEVLTTVVSFSWSAFIRAASSLSDIGLPYMDGRELARQARIQRPTLPVLLMTGYAAGAINRQLFLDDSMDILLKPFQIHELLEKVRRTLTGAL